MPSTYLFNASTLLIEPKSNITAIMLYKVEPVHCGRHYMSVTKCDS
jgi:hypothetical protein